MHPVGKITVTQKKVVMSPFMYQMHDMNLEYWQAFCCFCFGFTLPVSVEMMRKTWKHFKMGDLAACLCSGIAHLRVGTANQRLPTVVMFSL